MEESENERMVGCLNEWMNEWMLQPVNTFCSRNSTPLGVQKLISINFLIVMLHERKTSL